MSDEGSRGSRLPLALPPASQGCSSGGGGGGSSAGGSGNSRPPRNLQGLLQMAITAGSEEPDPPPEPMSEERRQWLQEAMSAAFRGQREEVEQMKSCLRVLSQPMPPTAGEAEQAADQQEREGALELLADLCENMDNAADFCQLSGMHLLVGRYLEAGAAGLRWRAAQLIGTCSQNVAAIQEQVLGLGALRKLLRLLDRDACDTVRVKALFAISCLVREQEAGLLQFLRLDGFSVLMRAMQQQVQKLKVKSAFLLQNLLVGHPEHKGTLCSMGMVQQLVALVRTEHSPFHEHVLGALCRVCASVGSRNWAWRSSSATAVSCCSSMRSTRRSWSSVKSCYRPVSPAQRTTAWIGETRWLLAPFSVGTPGLLPPSPPTRPSPKGSQGLGAWTQGVPARLCAVPGRGAEKGTSSLDPTSHALTLIPVLLSTQLFQ
ncbi:hsp70-binding protein 1 isoform X1 [Homo sapiens]|nr:hsp70-binding protein 1 isoform X1 [Homo sapiens]XP_011524993.1 hsp70-binding protein 1 isoform X1 [Homo sapiens]XP_024307204.1 hsp70-binding protein 1 isoform X1 [Homo sapiens]XP_054176399.1 hsp70-binding protein 1 isoform X1 [Homo sapiens]XP_054176400.1 hsp70-binding protein 1 isoform X1 [Homo sapiens]XP_054176401.1 hsp70-binding protein 1 isoform X1 [Homo sapiens]|eukprot:XP_005258757.1 hsp70-binding protein 1 isoform X1 [Homo sapiens]